MSRLSTNKPITAQTDVELFLARLEAAHVQAGDSREGLSAEAIASLLQFGIAQSCHKCIPCCIGLVRMLEIVEAVSDGRAYPEDLDILEDCACTLFDACECEIGFEPARAIVESVPAWREAVASGANAQDAHASEEGGLQ